MRWVFGSVVRNVFHRNENSSVLWGLIHFPSALGFLVCSEECFSPQ